MKTLKDGTNISSRMYYYLLDYVMYRMAGHKISVIGLTKEEFMDLFSKATQEDMKELK